MKVVGVGCIWLDLSTPVAFDDEQVSGRDILNSFKRALESIENISNVVISGVDDATDRYWQGAEVTHGNDENRIIPIFPFCNISFHIYLPERVQKQISDGRYCGSESFHVDLVYDYYMPVTYVSYDIDPAHGALNPSTAVMIIRKLLEQRLSGDVISGCVGPSPFHADFMVIPRAGDDDESTFLERVPGKYFGYETIIISCPASLSDIPDILSSVTDVFAAFYYLHVFRAKILKRSSYVMDLAQGLLEPKNEKRFKRMVKMFRDGRVIADISREMTLGRLDHLRMEEFIQEGERGDFLGDKTPIKRYFLEFRQSKKTSIWHEIEGLIRFSEERRQKLFSNFSTLSASLLGGIIGAVIASTLTYLLTLKSQ